jgi:hypothetical protein
MVAGSLDRPSVDALRQYLIVDHGPQFKCKHSRSVNPYPTSAVKTLFLFDKAPARCLLAPPSPLRSATHLFFLGNEKPRPPSFRSTLRQSTLAIRHSSIRPPGVTGDACHRCCYASNDRRDQQQEDKTRLTIGESANGE